MRKQQYQSLIQALAAAAVEQAQSTTLRNGWSVLADNLSMRRAAVHWRNAESLRLQVRNDAKRG